MFVPISEFSTVPGKKAAVGGFFNDAGHLLIGITRVVIKGVVDATRNAMQRLRFLAVTAVALAGMPLAGVASPYIVSGNQHIVVGITLDEDAVRAALPAGLEPAEGISGGINIYNSGGGEGVEPFQRSYVWVDLAAPTSLTGTPARYVLWISDSHSSEEIKATWGYQAEAGSSVLEVDDEQATGTTMIGDTPVLTVSVDLGSDACTPGAGSLNYPGAPPAADGAMIVTQYIYSAEFCGATPRSVDVLVAEGHVLAGFKPTSLTWAVLARDLTLAVSPNFDYEP